MFACDGVTPVSRGGRVTASGVPDWSEMLPSAAGACGLCLPLSLRSVLVS